MQVRLGSGKYVVAVSGGVDSVVLLDLLAKQPDLELVVAHFDHGIRPESKEDREFVAKLAQKYGLQFVYEEGKLGKSASEDKARQARYDFLERVRKKYNANAVVTAHHQDDVIETMFINLLRGTKQKGLVSLSDTPQIRRPLLQMTKQQIRQYAQAHHLKWREDSTNQDTRYLRNWLRHRVISKLTLAQRADLLEVQARTTRTSREMEQLLAAMGADRPQIDKSLLLVLPYDVACEYVAQWLRNNNIRDFDNKTVARIVIGAKTLASSKIIDIKKGHHIQVGTQRLVLIKASVAKK